MTNAFTQPDYSAQSGDAYKALIDAAIEIVNKTAGAFNPHAQTVPDMTLRVDAGTVYNPITRARTDVAAQSTGTITAPAANPRKDIVCVGILTGSVSVITGAEAGSPTDPAITADLIPIARITLQTSTTTITNAICDDIRELGNLGFEASAVALKNIANTWTKTQTWTKGSDVASATNITLGDGNLFDITGTTEIETIATKGVGTTVKCHFDAATPLKNSADLVVLGGADFTTAAGDEAEFYEYATGDWRMSNYHLAASAPGGAGITLATPQATTSGTSFNFGSIPAGTKQIIVSYDLVSLDGTDNLLIQIGDGGGIETSGYNSTSSDQATPVASTAGFIVKCGFAAGVFSGQMILSLENATTFKWSEQHGIAEAANAIFGAGAGGKTLSAELTQVTVTRDGTDNFDAGEVNIQYQ
jgi:hypothetical protein